MYVYDISGNELLPRSSYLIFCKKKTKQRKSKEQQIKHKCIKTFSHKIVIDCKFAFIRLNFFQYLLFWRQFNPTE